MAQGYDKYELDNQTGQSFRFALNDILEASATQNSGDNSPNTANTSYPYQVWVDTTNDIVKIRDAATAGSWYSLYSVDADGKPTGAVAYGSYTIATNDTAGNGGTTAITVDTSQRVGIGTETPSEKLDVSGTGDVKAAIQTTSTGTGANAALRFKTGDYNWLLQTGDTVSGGLRFYDSTNSSERARIDSSGRLLVGTPSAISGSGANDNLQLVNSAGSILSVASSDTTISSGTRIGEIEFWGQPGSTWGNFATIGCFGDAAAASGDNPGRLVFSTTADGASSPTERMRITSSGFAKHTSTGTYVGASANYHEFRSGAYDNVALYVDHNSSSPYGLFLKFSGASPDNNTNYFIRGDDFTFNRFTVYSDGDVVTADQGTLTSDATLKRDITDATPKLADVMNLQVRNYYWKEDYHPNKQNKLIGFIAQEFEEVFPGLVTEHEVKAGEPILDEEGNDTGEKTPGVYKKCIREGKLIPILVKALQEAVERIETLEAKVAALESA